jgi:hypothetical protein
MALSSLSMLTMLTMLTIHVRAVVAILAASEWEADNPNRRDQTVRYLQRYVDEHVKGKGKGRMRKTNTAR